MLSDGFYDNGLIAFSQNERANKLSAYCREEGLDYQHLLAETHGRRLLFLVKKQSRNKLQAASARS